MDPFESEEGSVNIFGFAPHDRGAQGEWHDKIQNTDCTKMTEYKIQILYIGELNVEF